LTDAWLSFTGPTLGTGIEPWDGLAAAKVSLFDGEGLLMNAPAPILSSMKKDGSRIMIHPADVRGKWIRRRQWVYAGLILFFILGPLVPIGGHPMFFFDVEHRSFFIFGETFNPQDFWMVLLVALSFAFGLLLVTAAYGRVWCGWTCGQTVFMEGVIRPIERFFEGPRERRIKLEQEPWTANKILRRAGKLTAIFLVSLCIAHTFAAVLVSPRELWLMITEGPFKHPEASLLTLGASAFWMFDFAWFREQFCVVICPWGRAQSFLHDEDSVVISYDEARGEPRGKLVKDPPPGVKMGDCVDCTRCIQVCPTGIDIRNGLQMECLSCTQCIDACDEVMLKLNRAPGLITFLSRRQLAGHPRRRLRPRLFVYGALMSIALVSLVVALATRTPFEANAFRARGQNPFVLDGDLVRNPFEVHVFNKNPKAARFHFELVAPVPAEVSLRESVLELDSLTDSFVPVLVSVDRKFLGKPIDLQLLVRDEVSGAEKKLVVRFLAPFGYGPRS
jgi:cytochrome c oxidase accessory protein FixG